MGSPLQAESNWFGFEGELRTLEVACGYDGPLRGLPKPVVIFALYVRHGASLQLAGRSLHRFDATKPFPSVSRANLTRLPSCQLSVSSPPHFIALALALEEDGGHDVQRLFAAVEHHSELLIWEGEAAEPVPLVELPDTPDWQRPRPVQLLIDTVPASRGCHSDKWVDANCWCMPARRVRSWAALRLPFRSHDRRNDWTGIVAAGY